MQLAELVKLVDAFLDKHSDPTRRTQMKVDLLELVQKAVDHGEGKDQGKMAGIITKTVKAFFGKKDE